LNQFFSETSFEASMLPRRRCAWSRFNETRFRPKILKKIQSTNSRQILDLIHRFHGTKGHQSQYFKTYIWPFLFLSVNFVRNSFIKSIPGQFGAMTALSFWVPTRVRQSKLKLFESIRITHRTILFGSAQKRTKVRALHAC
jgi:hypothetical protein